MGLLQLLLEQPALGDVLDHGKNRASSGENHCVPEYLHLDDTAVLRAMPPIAGDGQKASRLSIPLEDGAVYLQFDGAAVLGQNPDLERRAIEIFSAGEFCKFLAGQFLFGVSGDRFARRIKKSNGAVRIEGPDH